MSDRRRRVAAAFGRAADRYEAEDVVQRQAALSLGAAIVTHGVRPGCSVLEIGCGTGRLTGALVGLGAQLHVASDVAPAMVRACWERHPWVVPLCMEGERPAIPGPFDLICASFVLQWIEQPAAAILHWKELLAPGGLLALATLGPGTFASFRAACLAEGVAAPTPNFPAAEELLAGWRGDCRVNRRIRTVHYPSGLVFLRSLKAVGAGTPRVGHRPLSAGRLRRVAARLDGPQGTVAEYEIVELLLTA